MFVQKTNKNYLFSENTKFVRLIFLFSAVVCSLIGLKWSSNEGDFSSDVKSIAHLT